MPLFGHLIRSIDDSISREKMHSTKKLQSYRRALFAGPRRSQPSINALNRAVRAQVDADHHLVQAIIRDSEKRAALIRGMELDPLTHSVWNDFDHSSAITELAPGDYALRSGDPVEIERVYDVLNGGRRGRGRWATYITKNALLGDSRIGAKRTYMSHAATQAVRELWGLMRDR